MAPFHLRHFMYCDIVTYKLLALYLPITKEKY